MKPNCAHCGRESRLATGQKVYPHRKDLYGLRFWVCDPCSARVGCHKDGAKTDTGVSDGTMPLGTPANAELRRARSKLHGKLDPLWRSAPKKQRRTARRRAYRIIARSLGISMEEAHVGMFDIDRCRQAWVALNGMTTDRIMAKGRFDPDADSEAPRDSLCCRATEGE